MAQLSTMLKSFIETGTAFFLREKVAKSLPKDATVQELVFDRNFQELARRYVQQDKTEAHNMAFQVAITFLTSQKIEALPLKQKYRELERFLSKFRPVCSPLAAIVERHAREYLYVLRQESEGVSPEI